MMRYPGLAMLLAVTISTPAVSLAGGEGSIDTLTVEDVYESFIDEGFVVEGTVESIERVEVLPDDISPGHPGKRKIPMVRLGFKISRVLIGELDKSEITVVGTGGYRMDYAFDLEVGDRYILAPYYSDRGSFNKGGTYPLRRDDSRFLIDRDRWFRGRKRDFMGSGRLDDLYRAIGEIRKMRSIDALAREADLIVRGTVLDTVLVEKGSYTKHVMYVLNVRMELSAVLRGELEEEVFTFQMLPYVNYRPSWFKLVPVVSPGEEWIVILKWIPEIGYYPFAGRNGMFEVEGDRLIRDNRVVLKQTLEDLEDEVAEAISRGDYDEDK